MSTGSILLPCTSVAIPTAGKLHPALRHKVESVQSIAAQVQQLGHVGLVGDSAAFAEVNWLVKHHGQGVYSLPYLHPEYCAALADIFSVAGYDVNPDEEPPAQIPEIVLHHRSKPLFDCLSVLWENVARPLATVLWGLDPVTLASVQAAQYDVDVKPGTALHHDAHSDVTLVVNLGTEFEGGGTYVAPGLHEPGCTVPPLPVGHAMFFRGRTQLHQGLPVTSGTRTLLVHWATTT